MLERFIQWLSSEPAAVFLLIAASAGAFAAQYHRSAYKNYPQRVLEAASSALLLFGLVWMVHTGLSMAAAVIGHRQQAAVAAAKRAWGEPLNLTEVFVNQYHTEEVREQIPRKDKDQPPEWHTYETLVNTWDYKCTRFRGQINLQVDEKFYGYHADIDLIYQIQSTAAVDTEMRFQINTVPLVSENQNVEVWMDNLDVHPVIDREYGTVFWETSMKPGQESKVHIRYTMPGTDSLAYWIPFNQIISDSLLTITFDRIPVQEARALIDGIYPTGIRPSDDGKGSVLTWKLDQSVTDARIGVRLPEVDSLGAKTMPVLFAMPAAACLLAGLIALISLILNGRVDFSSLVLSLTAFLLEFLALALVTGLVHGLWGWLALAPLVFACLFAAQWWWGSSIAGWQRWLPLGLFALFAVSTPLMHTILPPEQQNAIRFYGQGALVLLLLVLWQAAQRKPTAGDLPGAANEASLQQGGEHGTELA